MGVSIVLVASGIQGLRRSGHIWDLERRSRVMGK
jgi:hypothetical protein